MNSSQGITRTSVVRSYYELCKPRVVFLMILTSFVGMCLASSGFPRWLVAICGNVGIGLCAAAAAVINHLADHQIDRQMERTKNRPVAKDEISFISALIFSATLALFGVLILLAYTNVLATVLTFISVIGYAGIYTFYLKHATSQNIVIGGLAGAAPPLLGWVAVTGAMHPLPVILVMIIFFWTPPHFWALAIDRIEDYKKVDIPMLPVTHGITYTKKSMLAHTALLAVTTVLPVLCKYCYLIYAIGVVVLNVWFASGVYGLYRDDKNKNAFAVFKNSITYLALLFIFLLVDHCFPVSLF